MSKAHYQEITAATALNRVQGMGFRWSLNPYQGCVHGCHYCFARRYHYLRELSPGDDFSDTISVKVNLPELLRHELSRRSWKYETVAIGTATDPYQPIEGTYRLTRSCLEALCSRGNPISLVTKGTLVLRDIDVLSELARKAECTVCFSITTLDDSLRSRLELGTPPPRKRLVVMEKLAASGVRAGVILAPVIPGVTDSVANLEEVVREAAQRGACFLSSNTLFLKEGTREHFLEFLGRDYPSLMKSYGELYPGSFAPWGLKQSIERRVADLKRTYRLKDRGPAVQPTQRVKQLPMAI